ncbi:hypothetical protein B0H17DRAFT_1149167 [Mycena rosella]|uniref:Uncharacterized protein n=1 Tax=Mycena rosella TaxID=1033263 RepID=A0AAD7C686_MYCRO|nr:hypothetical protein B0H17DRAFT_1149167 [Mycena rosella]
MCTLIEAAGVRVTVMNREREFCGVGLVQDTPSAICACDAPISGPQRCGYTLGFGSEEEADADADVLMCTMQNARRTSPRFQSPLRPPSPKTRLLTARIHWERDIPTESAVLGTRLAHTVYMCADQQVPALRIRLLLRIWDRGSCAPDDDVCVDAEDTDENTDAGNPAPSPSTSMGIEAPEVERPGGKSADDTFALCGVDIFVACKGISRPMTAAVATQTRADDIRELCDEVVPLWCGQSCTCSPVHGGQRDERRETAEEHVRWGRGSSAAVCGTKETGSTEDGVGGEQVCSVPGEPAPTFVFRGPFLATAAAPGVRLALTAGTKATGCSCGTQSLHTHAAFWSTKHATWNTSGTMEQPAAVYSSCASGSTEKDRNGGWGDMADVVD